MKGRVLRTRLRERILVTTKTSETYDGVLYSEDERCIVLRSCTVVAAGDRNDNVPVDGELIVFISDIAFIQRP